jgi:peptide/nickel transport system permease protein
MAMFVIRRLVMLLVALVVASFVIFISVHIAPGSALATLTGGKALLPAARRHLIAEYNLNAPMLTQYWDYVTGIVLHGNLGTSIQYKEPVSTLISQRIGVTAELVLYSSLLIVLLGIGLGIFAGLRPGAADQLIGAIMTVLTSLPTFVAAVILIAVFAVKWHLFPALGSSTGFITNIKYLTLPAFALATAQLAVVVRVTKVSVRTELEREHVQTAIARGIPWGLTVRRHVIRNASIPIATVTGITITSLLASASVVEQAFSINGIGSALIEAASTKDLAVVQGISLLLVAAFVIANTCVDLLYAVLDPRVTMGSRAE